LYVNSFIYKTPCSIDFFKAGAKKLRKHFTSVLISPQHQFIIFNGFPAMLGVALFLLILEQKEAPIHSMEVTISRMYNFLPAGPQYRVPFSVDSNMSTVRVDWSSSFLPNGQLMEYVLTDGGQRMYSGLDTTLYIPRTPDKS
jgi:hypothetical protein